VAVLETVMAFCIAAVGVALTSALLILLAYFVADFIKDWKKW